MATADHTERWLPVVGWEDRYQVSDHGRVWSNERLVYAGRGHSRINKGRILKTGSKPAGYPIVSARTNDGGSTHLYVHRMVLEAFVGPAPLGHVARHLDDDKKNNRLSNLAWGTESDNSYDKVVNGNDHYAKRDACKWGHEFTPENTYRDSRHPNTRHCRECSKERAARQNAKEEVKAYKAQWQRTKKASRARST